MSMNNKYIIIIGCGRLGRVLTGRFSSQGHSLVVVDSNAEKFSLLGSDFSGFTIEGDAIEMAVLIQARIDKADALLAVTNNDNINLMVAQVAKDIYMVPQVMARVYDPKREIIYKNLNVSTVCPMLLAADEFFKLGQG